ncbi:MAG: RNA methyltransferase [Chloroflexi bacterium]|nr:RNA methyltransferase [Chloroflexota bacterium]
MPQHEIITSHRNRRIIEARKLDQRKQRRRQGRFLVEGLQALGMALEAQIAPDELFVCEELLTGQTGPALVLGFSDLGRPPTFVSAEVLDSLSTREQAQGLVAVFPSITQAIEALPLDVPGLTLVLDRLSDPGNLGTLIRTADAIGATGVVLIAPSADPTDPKAVRASMGSIFNLPITESNDPAALFDLLDQHTVTSIAADPQQGVDWGEGLWRDRCALLLGSEGPGLSDDLREHITAWARLPMHGKAESLNVAVAGGILMYAWLRTQRPD